MQTSIESDILHVSRVLTHTASINSAMYPSLVPRPSPAPVFDRLQYAKTEGEGLVNLTT